MEAHLVALFPYKRHAEVAGVHVAQECNCL